jgi:hypothetical protein
LDGAAVVGHAIAQAAEIGRQHSFAVAQILGEVRLVESKRGDGTRLSARAVDVVDRLGAGSFEPELWSTLVTTRRVAVIGVSRF